MIMLQKWQLTLNAVEKHACTTTSDLIISLQFHCHEFFFVWRWCEILSLFQFPNNRHLFKVYALHKARVGGDGTGPPELPSSNSTHAI